MPRASRFDSRSFIRLTMLHGFLFSFRKLSLHFCIRYYILHHLLFICDTILPILLPFVNLQSDRNPRSSSDEKSGLKQVYQRCSNGETRLYKTTVTTATTIPLTMLNGSVMNNTNVNGSFTKGKIAVPMPTITSIGRP